MTTGAQLKEEGIDLVLAREDDVWRATYLGLARAYMAEHPQGFTAEDCKVHARFWGLGEPHHPNAWSAIWGGLAKSRKIEKTGRYVKSGLPSRHANEVPEWRITELF